ncbi:hypothetical protein UlMin_015783 [Ulmus minor]
MATTNPQNDTYGAPNDACNGSRYLIVRPDKGRLRDLFRYAAFGDIGGGAAFLETSDAGVLAGEATDHRWVIVVSIIVRKVISFFGKPMEWTGYIVEFILNLLSENGNLIGLLYNLFHGKVVIPQRGSETFISTIGQFDGRIDLFKSESLAEDISGSSYAETGMQVEMGNLVLMDLCIMASKLAYENDKVVRNVVVHHWKMHFVDFYNCWNDFQKEMATQVFILCDKPKDANLILISFRGTEPFDADDWSTDFDYTWYEIPKVGKIHMGFLEALGLGSRTDAVTFQYHLLANCGTSSIGKKKLEPLMENRTAYYAVRSQLKSLLKEHKNAKFVVTGHSLGGALAILFPTVLVLHQEIELMHRLLGVYTFGQPRIGDRNLGSFMEVHLNIPVPRYFRMVYCNDIVPRIPYDDKTFLYKHFGVCLYYNSLYFEQNMKEEPNKNYFTLRNAVPMHLNAVWELIRSLLMKYLYGPEYKEGWFCIMGRVIGLAYPGLSAHFATDYVNSVRLGKKRTIQMSSL